VNKFEFTRKIKLNKIFEDESETSIDNLKDSDVNIGETIMSQEDIKHY